LRGKVRCVTIDLDPTDDPTHGSNSSPSSMRITILTAICRCSASSVSMTSLNNISDGAPAARHATGKDSVVVGLLERLVGLVRAAFPQATIKLRLDGGFAGPQMFDYLDSVPRLEYVCGLAKNAVLARKAEPLLVAARKLAQLTNQSARVFGECNYQAQSWEQARRVNHQSRDRLQPAWRAERQSALCRHQPTQTPKFIYKKAYCSRGEIENRIKELHHGLQLDRTSCRASGQPVSRPAHRRCLRPHAGDQTASPTHHPGPRPSHYPARATCSNSRAH